MLVIFKHIIPFHLWAIGKGRIISDENPEAQTDDVAPKWLSLEMSPWFLTPHDGMLPSLGPRMEHERQEERTELQQRNQLPCPQRQDAEQIHIVSSTCSESYSTGQFRQRPSLCSWIWNMACVLGHLYKKTISSLPQPQSHLLPEADLEGGRLGRFFHELPGEPRVNFMLSVGLCFSVYKRMWFSGVISLGCF